MNLLYWFSAVVVIHQSYIIVLDLDEVVLDAGILSGLQLVGGKSIMPASSSPSEVTSISTEDVAPRATPRPRKGEGGRPQFKSFIWRLWKL